VSVSSIHDISTVVLRTESGFFLRFKIEDVPEKKKGAVGVRGMRLTGKDTIREVYYLKDAEEMKIEHNGKEINLDHLKIASRDTKGTKIRV
jgi:DNA gyrase subunit A